MRTQGTQTEENSAMYTRTPVDWQRRIVLLTPQGTERDGGPIARDWETREPVVETLQTMGYTGWFTIPGLSVLTGDGEPQTHAFCACLALGGTTRIFGFERLTDLASFVATWIPILEAVGTTD